MIRKRLRGVTALAALGLATAAGVVGIAAWPAHAATAWPAHVFAPYADTWSGNITLSNVASQYGTKFFTIAFVDGAGCQWSIGEQSSLQSQIAALRAQGGDVAISFGGYTSDANLTELGDSCSSPQAAATQIESVASTFGVTHLDFDIEANSLTNAAGIDRRDKALALVRSWASGQGLSLTLSFTIPTLPSGLTQDGLNLLANARSNGFTPDIVNVMTMDYGTSGTEMGDAAVQALGAVAGQVASTFGISTSAAYAKLGDTPMIGQNDSAGEIFTVADGATLESAAASDGIALLSYWDENRDNGGCPGQTSASGTCSGLSQNTGDFARTFQGFTGGGGSGGSGSQSLPGTWSQCAAENGTCAVSGASVIAYGAGGRFNYVNASGATSCSNAVFGDPNSGVAKACYVESAPPGTNVWAQCAGENGTCSFSGVMTVAYGANGSYNYATVGSVACSNSVFGDPAPGTAKACYVVGAPPSFTTWTSCSAENGSCSFSGTHEVAYGANGQYFYGSFTDGTSCSNAVFGDPAFGTAKTCYVQ
ncbi:MAG TPA: chitinase [Actinocrinis sp.]|jgi:hypothetical protein|uniref:chitinase n=1 Tax=Actinocrinis sp. TaxID=1920516 RepID=UPI002DDCD4C3|nr:chitinase [Actinocrinis sp.]HEV3170681.1 chitinase [Actinocrinis sp.]